VQNPSWLVHMQTLGNLAGGNQVPLCILNWDEINPLHLVPIRNIIAHLCDIAILLLLLLHPLHPNFARRKLAQTLCALPPNALL
jgi:hypothetical protein